MRIAFCFLLALGCAAQPVEPNTKSSGGGKADDGSSTSHINCQLEYVSYANNTTAPAASIDASYADIAAAPRSVIVGNYGFAVARNNDPSSQLPFNAMITDGSGATLTYVVLPDLRATSYFNFELGTAIPTLTLGDASYDHLRAYCAVQ